MVISERHDLESSKGALHNHASETGGDIDVGVLDETYEVKHVKELQANNGFFRKLRAGEEWSVIPMRCCDGHCC